MNQMIFFLPRVNHRTSFRCGILNAMQHNTTKEQGKK